MKDTPLILSVLYSTIAVTSKHCLSTILLLCFLFSTSCNSNKFQTVNGYKQINEGIILTHEHIVTDFRRVEEEDNPQYNEDDIVSIILPHLLRLKSKGVTTIFECTPRYIGRDVRLLQRLSDTSGINIITNTGFYAAVNKKYLPQNINEMSVEAIYNVWKSEWKEGINDSGVRPGFIKLGVGNGKLDEIETKLLTAAVRLSHESDMVIAIHTGDGEAAFSEYEIATKLNLSPDKVIWVHAQNGTNEERSTLAKNGMWISLDGISEYNLSEYVEMITYMKTKNVLHKVLISHDDGWSVVENEQSKISITPFKKGYEPYLAVTDMLIPELKKIGFTQTDIQQLLYENAAVAFSLK